MKENKELSFNEMLIKELTDEFLPLTYPERICNTIRCVDNVSHVTIEIMPEKTIPTSYFKSAYNSPQASFDVSFNYETKHFDVSELNVFTYPLASLHFYSVSWRNNLYKEISMFIKSLSLD